MSLRTRQGDYMFLARDREAAALRKLQNMPWAEDRPSIGREALTTFLWLGLFAIGALFFAAVMP